MVVKVERSDGARGSLSRASMDDPAGIYLEGSSENAILGPMTPTLKERLTSLLASKKEIGLAYLFGSHADGSANAMSDLDIAVYPSPETPQVALLELQTELMETARMARMDLVDLRKAPPVLIYEVVTTGLLLVAQDTEFQNRFERRAFLHYFDTQHLRNVQNEYLRDHLRAS